MVRASKKRKLQQEGEDGSSASRVKEPSAKKAKGESASPGKNLKKKNKFKKEGETEKPTEKKSKSRNAGHSQGKKTQKVKSSISKGGINGSQSGKSAKVNKVKNGAKVNRKNSA
jgi:hypothetical protein